MKRARVGSNQAPEQVLMWRAAAVLRRPPEVELRPWQQRGRPERVVAEAAVAAEQIVQQTLPFQPGLSGLA